MDITAALYEIQNLKAIMAWKDLTIATQQSEIGRLKEALYDMVDQFSDDDQLTERRAVLLLKHALQAARVALRQTPEKFDAA